MLKLKIKIILTIFISFLLVTPVFANDYASDLDYSSDEYYYYADNADFDLQGTDFSFIASVYHDGANPNPNTILSKCNTLGYRAYTWYYSYGIDTTWGTSDDQIVFNWFNSADNADYNSVYYTLSPSTWYTIGIRHDVSEGRTQFWVNGEYVGQDVDGNTDLKDVNAPFRIGEFCNAGGTYNHDGLIDEVRIYNTYVASSTMEEENDCELDDYTDLVAYYQFDSQDGTDSTANSYDLTQVNTPSYVDTPLPFDGICSEEVVSTTTPTTFSVGTSTIPADLDYINDISIITALTYHYESSTATPDYIEKHYIRIPFVIWLIIYLIVIFIIERLIIEIIIRLRKL